PEHPHQWDGSDEHRHVDKEAGETIDGLASAGDIREGGAVLQLLIHPRGAYCGNVVSHDVWNPLLSAVNNATRCGVDDEGQKEQDQAGCDIGAGAGIVVELGCGVGDGGGEGGATV